MSNPVNFDENLLNSDNKFDNFCVNNDFVKLPFLDFGADS